MSLKNNGLIRSFARRLKRQTQTPKREAGADEANYASVARADHVISRNDISNNALKVLYRLKDEGFTVYLVGGSVRDLLLKRKPKDFDVVTDATPEQARKIFRNSRIIGRRFRLVHVYFKNEIIEVSTFRANIEEPHVDEGRIKEGNEKLVIKADNVFGTIEEDAWRRDFTVNALYYTVKDFSVVDYTGGLADLDKRQIRMIGDPLQRFHEDPVRLLRAIRLAAKLEFSIEPATEKPLRELNHLLQHVPQARLLDELIKLFFEGNAVITFKFLNEMDYVPTLFPTLDKLLKDDSSSKIKILINAALRETDARFHSGRHLTPGFLLGVFLWPVAELAHRLHQKNGMRFFKALHQAMTETIKDQSAVCLVTKRMVVMMHSMWTLQYHLEKRRPKRILHLLKQRFFRAAFDLLELRAEAGQVPLSLVKWWRDIQSAKPKKQLLMVENLK